MNDIIAKPISKRALFDCIQTFYREEGPSVPGGVPSAKPRGNHLLLDPLPDPNLAPRRVSTNRDELAPPKLISPPNLPKSPRSSEVL
jgi:hypothetical protein